MKATKQAHWILIGILLLAGFLRLYALETLPGLHADEAWFGLRAMEITEGVLPFNGMNRYTGPLFAYLAALPFLFFHPSIFWLRFVPALFGILTVVLSYLLLKPYNRQGALLSSLLFAILPWSIIHNRTAWEVSLFPFFLILLLYLYDRKKYPFLQGLLLGFLTYTHILFAIVPLFLIAHILWKQKQQCIAKSNRTYNGLLLLGILVGYAPRIILGLSFPEGKGPGLLVEFIPRFIAAVPVFFSQFNGAVLFLRATGEIASWVIPLNAILLLLAFSLFAWRWWKGKTGSFENMLAAFFLASFVFIFIFVSRISLRYFIIPNTFATLLLACNMAALPSMVPKQHSKYILQGLCILFLLVNLPIFWLNYFDAFQKTGGKFTIFQLGKDTESSAHFARSDLLYDCITEYPIKTLSTEDYFLGEPMTFYKKIMPREKVEGKGKIFMVAYPDKEFDPVMYEKYQVTEVCTELTNFKAVMLDEKVS
ncbi:glycosyltransferase family 39 protein [Candidatus Woesearchaeota archaeon]|nr:glycosyltransferase family 39 protein [Candidatus Woesearchaeota archaeon]